MPLKLVDELGDERQAVAWLEKTKNVIPGPAHQLSVRLVLQKMIVRPRWRDCRIRATTSALSRLCAR